MVERVPDYQVNTKSVSLLGNMVPFVSTDVTNPRKLYSMLSNSKHQTALLTSVPVNPQAGAKLPPLNMSLDEVPIGSRRKQPQHGSYPDLVSLRKQHDVHGEQDAVRRSSSLQDVSSVDRGDSLAHTRRLKPILRAGDTNKPANQQQYQQQQDKGGVKFGSKEVHLIKERPLPPIETIGSASLAKDGIAHYFSEEPGTRHADDLSLSLYQCPRPQRQQSSDCPSDMFPRGQPMEIKKPVTPTYDDYPEAYWELRSPTVQDPSDLKEDMIDRDRYRLQQISSLRLRAINRELVVNKMDSLRKWQQQILEYSSPPGGRTKQPDSARGSGTSVHNGVGNVSARSGRQQRMLMPVRNHSLAIAAVSISPNPNPAIKKRNGAKNADQGMAEPISEDELRNRQKIEAAARGETDIHDVESKAVKAAVVNLCIDPDPLCNTPTSDVYTGIRRIMLGTRPRSNQTRKYISGRSQDTQQQTNGSALLSAQLARPVGSTSGVSISATRGSSPNHLLQRVPSAPASTPAGSVLGPAEVGGPADTDTSMVGKKILKKFKRLQVFSEKYGPAEKACSDPWDVVSASQSEKTPYLPQNRPPTYKLDTRRYPTRRNGSAPGADNFKSPITEDYGFSMMPGDRSRTTGAVHSPDKPEATSLSFRFNNGEVVVSRQGKRC